MEAKWYWSKLFGDLLPTHKHPGQKQNSWMLRTFRVNTHAEIIKQCVNFLGEFTLKLPINGVLICDELKF